MRATLAKVPGLALVSLALLAVAASVAYATIPDSAGVIHGCYLNKVGVLRVIDTAAGQKCTALETAIQWNQTGPPGPKGLNWRGAYNSNSSYAVDDVVFATGSSWVATAPLTATPCSGICLDNNAPGLNPAWQLLAQQGEVGAPGSATPGRCVQGSLMTGIAADGSIICTTSEEAVRDANGVTKFSGAGAQIQIGGNAIVIRNQTASGSSEITIDKNGDIAINSGSSVVVQSGGLATVGGSKLTVVGVSPVAESKPVTQVLGDVILFHDSPSCKPIARSGDPVAVSLLLGLGTISLGSPHTFDC
jgi:hypothetical protein